MTQQHMFGRMLEWFERQDRMIQLIVVGLVPEDQVRPTVEMLYEQYVKSLGEPDVLDQAQAIADEDEVDVRRRRGN